MSQKIPYIIGDIHGCLQEYLELEKKIKDHAKKNNWEPVYVCVGDLIDRGPNSLEVVDHFIAGAKAKTHFCVLGNHESEFLRNIFYKRPSLFFDQGLNFPDHIFTLQEDYDQGKYGSAGVGSKGEFCELMHFSWLGQGGSETLESFGLDPEKAASWDVAKKHLKYLAEMPIIWIDQKQIVTHALATEEFVATILEDESDFVQFFPSASEAGFNKVVKTHSSEDIKMAVHSLVWSRTPPSKVIDGLRIHVSGHTPLEKVRFSEKFNFAQIDTGCVYGAQLTAYCHESRDILNVSSKTKWSRNK